MVTSYDPRSLTVEQHLLILMNQVICGLMAFALVMAFTFLNNLRLNWSMIDQIK